MSNLIYQSPCPCTQIYIGQTKRFLKLRAEDHQRSSNWSHVCSHIFSCNHYDKKADEYAIKFRDKFTSLREALVEFFKNCFSLLEKRFRNDVERRRWEAYHIKLKRPIINDQKDLKAFGLLKKILFIQAIKFDRKMLKTEKFLIILTNLLPMKFLHHIYLYSQIWPQYAIKPQKISLKL
jgi:hypothetical protein